MEQSDQFNIYFSIANKEDQPTQGKYIGVGDLLVNSETG